MNESVNKLTSDELKAVQEISAIFTKQLIETGDITFIFDNYFVSDFAERYVKEKKRELIVNKEFIKKNLISLERLNFSPRLYFSVELLNKATASDWRRLYISNFNLGRFESSHALNQTAEYFVRKEKPDLTKIIFDLEIYPVEVIKLFENHPNLKGFIPSKLNSESIRTVEELKSVNDTLELGLKLLRENRNGKLSVEISENRKKIQTQIGTEPFFGAKAEITHTGFWGFHKRTRYVSVWIPPGYKILVLKVENEYKIILKPFP